MSTRDDPLVNPTVEGPDRVEYSTGMMLDAQDFRDEQLYHRGRLARCLGYLFGPGTVAGLKMDTESLTTDSGDVTLLRVSPGIAIDTIGRLIEIPSPVCLRLDSWWEAQEYSELADAFVPTITHPIGTITRGVVADLFLRYVQWERGQTPAFATTAFDGLDAAQPSRLRDGFELTLVPRPDSEATYVDLTRELDHLTKADDLLAITLAGSDIRNDILDGWHHGTANWTNGLPTGLEEHNGLTNIDTTSVMLGRVVLTATPPPADSPPGRVHADPVEVDTNMRRFVVSHGLLARRG